MENNPAVSCGGDLSVKVSDVIINISVKLYLFNGFLAIRFNATASNINFANPNRHKTGMLGGWMME